MRASPADPGRGVDYSPLSWLRGHAAEREALRGDEPDPCLLSLIALLPQPRSTYLRIERALDGVHSPVAAATRLRVLNRTGRSADVLASSEEPFAAHPLVVYERTVARLLHGDARAAADTLMTLVQSGLTDIVLQFHQNSYMALDDGTRKRLRAAIDADAEQAAILTGWWRNAAALSGMEPAERLSVHFRRLIHADSMYFGFRRRPRDVGDPPNAVFPDPRHEIMVRFGEPHRIIYTMIPGQPIDYVTWVYPDPESRHLMVFHVVGATASYGYHFVGCLELEWLADRATVTPALGALYTTCSTNSPLSNQSHMLAVRADRDATIRNLQRQLVLPSRALPEFSFALYRFRASGSENTELVAVVHGEAPAGSTFGVTLADTARQAHYAGSVDLRPGAVVNAAVVVPDMTAGQYVYRVRLRSADGGAARIYGGNIDIEAFTTRSIRSMSDIVLGRPGGTPIFSRGDVSLAPFFGVVDASVVDVYAELYGAAEGETFDVTLRVLGKRRLLRRPSHVTLEFSITADRNGMLPLRHTVEHGLPPGDYSLEMAVSSRRGGPPVRRELEFTVGT